VEGLLAVRQGRDLVVRPDGERQDDERETIGAPAWDFLAARAAVGANEARQGWEISGRLLEAGWLTEPLVRLRTEAAALLALETSPPPLDDVPAVMPQSAVAARLAWLWQAGEDEFARQLIANYRCIHPDWPPARWLWPPFWLDPVRRWLG
jgi:hypothetical protein